MSKHSTANLFDKAFAGLLEAESFEKPENEYNPNLYTESFDDEGESWGDLNSHISYKGPEPIQPVFSKPKVEEKPKFLHKDSQLVKKYFHTKAEEKPKPKPQKKDDESIKEIAAKIEELNEEIRNVKKEAEENKRLNILYEDKKRQFLKEKDELERMEQEVKEEIEEVNEKELAKFKRDAKVHERNQKALQNLPNKKERDEIDKLRGLLNKVKEESAITKNRFKLNRERVLKLIEEAKAKKNDLVQRLEKIDNLVQSADGVSLNPKLEKASVHENTAKNNGVVSMNLSPKTNNSKKPQSQDFSLDIFDTSQSKLEKSLPQNTDLLDLEIENITKTASEAKKNTEVGKVLEPLSLTFPECSESIPIVDKRSHQDGRVVILYESGHKETIYPNGTKKEEYLNGYCVNFYVNNDVKQVFPDGKILYFYAEANTTHTCFPDGSEIIRFGNGQIEKHYKDRSKKIKYIDGTVKLIKNTGEEVTTYPDNTRETIGITGERVVYHPGGHREIYSNGVTKRVYADGNSKILRK